MNLIFREAIIQDLPGLIALLADDTLGAKREDPSEPLNVNYEQAFLSIDVDPNNELIVAEEGHKIVGMLQLTFIPYLTYIGSWRCLIEGVRIQKRCRGNGLGTQFFKWAINRAKAKNCHLMQLTSDKQRASAIKFYEKLGFKASHEGFKLSLGGSEEQ
jgi:GNAT superfamily N-acetyltransferase